jgi:2-amino-4-hydroxy-6-hydroxymethyldihydropteridine diphosphokinase
MGSNLGDRESWLRFGLQHLRALGRIQCLSSLYETDPWGKSDQAHFLNAVCSLFSAVNDPLVFLQSLKAIEAEAGRESTERWGPRTLDLDLLFWGDQIITTPELIIPHPQIAQRRFVLLPLAEIAPDLKHPVNGFTIKEMLSACPDQGAVQIVGSFNA